MNPTIHTPHNREKIQPYLPLHEVPTTVTPQPTSLPAETTMPYFPTSQAWLHHSSLLLQAQPTTVRPCPRSQLNSPPQSHSNYKHSPCEPQTRITTKYTLTPPTSKRSKSSRRPQPSSTDSGQQPTQQQPPQPSTTVGSLVLKTYDPTSGVCLKYRTDKAAEVGRLIASLGRLGKYMSGVPVGEETEKERDGGDAPARTSASEVTHGGLDGGAGTVKEKEQKAMEKGKAGGAGGGGGKKKKGKK